MLLNKSVPSINIVRTNCIKMKILAFDTPAHNAYKSNLKRLKNLEQSLFDYCASLIEITDKAAFLESPTNYVVNQFRIKSNLNVTDEKITALYEVPVNEISKLQRSYFNQKRNVPDTEPDFNIYARDKAHEQTFKQLESLCEGLNNLKVFSDFFAIQRAAHNAIKITDGLWTPNPHYIG